MTGQGSPLIWVLVDPRAGTAIQALGVADRLGLAYVEKPLEYGMLARLPGAAASLRGLTGSAKSGIVAPWPDLVIASGRRAAAVARYVGMQSPATRLVQVMDPGGNLDDFDMLVIPDHDDPENRPNILPVTGAPHRITRARLDEAGREWLDRFEGMPRPWIALLVGGATKRKPFPAALAARLEGEADSLARETGGSLLISTSRRTGKAADIFEGGSPSNRYLYRYGDAGANPYTGILGLADAVIVTGDSVSMVCEACAAGVPVWIFSPPGFAVDKHAALHAELYRRGTARPFTGKWEDWQPEPLDEAGRVAAAVMDLISGKRG